jgi:hypothetical protein
MDFLAQCAEKDVLKSASQKMDENLLLLSPRTNEWEELVVSYRLTRWN